LVAELGNATAVHALAPDMAAITQLSRDLSIAGITVFGLTGRQPDAVYTRSFAPALNVPEDPVCGSGNASVGAFLAHFEKLGATGAAYVAHQGNEVGREGAITVTVNPADRSVEIGGQSVTCIEGTLRDRARPSRGAPAVAPLGGSLNIRFSPGCSRGSRCKAASPILWMGTRRWAFFGSLQDVGEPVRESGFIRQGNAARPSATWAAEGLRASKPEKSVRLSIAFLRTPARAAVPSPHYSRARLANNAGLTETLGIGDPGRIMDPRGISTLHSSRETRDRYPVRLPPGVIGPREWPLTRKPGLFTVVS
jgi:hypothetical protein